MRIYIHTFLQPPDFRIGSKAVFVAALLSARRKAQRFVESAGPDGAGRLGHESDASVHALVLRVRHESLDARTLDTRDSKLERHRSSIFAIRRGKTSIESVVEGRAMSLGSAVRKG